MIRATLAGIGIALAAGPLGCFVVWRQMAYFGDATAHAAVLGVALALAIEVPIVLGVLVTAIGMAVLVTQMRGSGLATDTLLGVAAHASLAVGLVAVALTPGRRLDLDNYLFGDIFSVVEQDLAMIWIGASIILGVLIWRWGWMLTATLNSDLASAEGINPDRERLILALMLAVLVAVTLKVIGALLITAMLIIPAATARGLTRTPEWMAALAALLGAIAVFVGVQMSLAFDTPSGPTIVTVAAAAFIFAQSLRGLRR
ncbi:UNVERIFIED_CONTAM: hypothetical protein GTU68_047656 [Idotea baltica]|nr:hypothetical protein [Idotea baltica]